MKFLLPTALILLITTQGFSQAPQVIGTSPIAQSLITAPGDAIFIMFDQPLNETTVTANTFQVFGR
jgi:hypothetical protein